MQNSYCKLMTQVSQEKTSRIKTTPKSIALEKRYQTEIADLKTLKRETEQENKKWKELVFVN